MFLGPPLPKTGQSGAADVAPVPGCHCTVLRSHTQLCHLPLPVVCLPKVGGGVLLQCTLVGLVGASREELGIEEKSKVGRERRLPLAPGPLVGGELNCAMEVASWHRLGG